MHKLLDLLAQKELAMKRLEKDIEAIRTVLAMLSETPDQSASEDAKQLLVAQTASAATTKPAGGYSAASQNALPDVTKLTPRWP